MGAWEDGFAAGFTAGLNAARPPPSPAAQGAMDKIRRARRRGGRDAATGMKKTRKASAANKRYGAAFKRLAPKYKKKSGGWKKDGFKRCAAAARKAAKK